MAKQFKGGLFKRQAAPDEDFTTTFRITRGLHAELVGAAEELRVREGHSRPDVSLVLRRVLGEWVKGGCKVPGP